MRKLIAAINMTLDGICDHRVGVVDEELHTHYAGLINSAGTILYGRTTYQLMQFWQNLLTNPSDQPSMNAFADSIDRIEKIVFSNTIQDTGWNTAKLAGRPLEDTVLELRKQPGHDILVGSRSLIIQLLNSRLIDEFQVAIHPMIEGKGLRLFENIRETIVFDLLKTKTLKSGVTIFYYMPKFEKTPNR